MRAPFAFQRAVQRTRTQVCFERRSLSPEGRTGEPLFFQFLPRSSPAPRVLLLILLQQRIRILQHTYTATPVMCCQS
jgi:hypothetical protein